jgi:hypothetical protein
VDMHNVVKKFLGASLMRLGGTFRGALRIALTSDRELVERNQHAR